MRHVIVVVGSEEQRSQPAPRLPKQDDESLRVTTWYASLDQGSLAVLLDDRRSAFMRILIAPLLAYRFYVLVHNIRLWSSKRPLILVKDRNLASRVAAYAGTWGGGDVVAASTSATMPLGPTRFLLDENGNLKLRTDQWSNQRDECSASVRTGMDLLKKLRKTPFHPQWFAFLREESNLRNSCASLYGTVLDIGCADGKPRRLLPSIAEHIGLDKFDTAMQWYGTRPDVFADAQQLPFASDMFDHVLLLDVAEHLPEPDLCVPEIFRVLKRGGLLTIQIPFLYPIHGALLDCHRWTMFGLQGAQHRAGFNVESEVAIGHRAETAALAANIAVSKTALNWIVARNPLAIPAILLPPQLLAEEQSGLVDSSPQQR